eukprot:1896824-Prymnesium_polylepis.1
MKKVFHDEPAAKAPRALSRDEFRAGALSFLSEKRLEKMDCQSDDVQAPVKRLAAIAISTAGLLDESARAALVKGQKSRTFVKGVA